MILRLDLDRPEDRARYEGYLATRPDAHVTDGARWRPFFRELYGFESVSLAAVEGAHTVGVASLYLVPSLVYGRLLVSSPFFGYGGLYADTPAAERALIAGLEEAGRALRADFVEIRLPRALPAPFQADESFAEFDLDVGGSADAMWTGPLRSNVRQNIRKAQRTPFVFSVTADPRPAYGLVARTVRDLGTPFHSQRCFTLLARRFPDAVRFSQVHLGGELVAAGLLVSMGGHLLTPYIGSLRDVRGGGANYAQYWGIVQHCVATRVGTFEFGRSPRGSTHEAWKRKWGVREVPMFYNHLALGARRWASVAEPTPLQVRAVQAYKRVPMPLARGLGHLLFRHIP
jgi:FemAB-related protein (PEP-CTERM system-associated)